jgi:plasmid stabilization system protein ParE
LKAIFLEDAREDLREAVRYYEAQRSGLGSEFRGEVRAAVERIKNFPDAWQSMNERTRRCRLRRFPYGVIYQVRGEEVVIAAVAHLHREPERWRDRL